MAARKDAPLLRQLDTLFNLGVIHELTDGQLLERFATGRGEAAELAFAALVERHGPMVQRVCRAQLASHHDAQDAFQATFLILVRKARGLWVRDSLGPWLHQVALRTASCARSSAARRRRHERQAAERAAGLDDRTDSDPAQMLHSEISRLPERYRVPIVLCDLEGHTCEEVARRMRRPVGTVKSWRSRGRERLRDRLIRRGLAPSAGLAAALAADAVHAAVPARTAEETVRLAVRFLTPRMTAGAVPASVRTMVSGVLTTMLVDKLRMTAATFIAVALLAAGLATIARVDAAGVRETADEARLPTRPAAVVPAGPSNSLLREEPWTWSLSLSEAIRTGVENRRWIRVIEPAASGAPHGGYVISPANIDVEAQQFRTDVMALVRSIEERYWNLGQQHVQLWGSQKAVELAEEVTKRLESQLTAGLGDRAALAEATRRLGHYRLDLATRTSDVLTAEGQLRNVLGLPTAEIRRLVPVTDRTESPLEPEWEPSHAAMLKNHPNVLRAKAKATSAADETRVRDAMHRATHSLAVAFLEVQSCDKQLKTASRLRVAAAEGIGPQRAFYEEGRITLDQYLDAVSRHASAVAQEAHWKTRYKVAMTAVEEAKGTLLAYHKITVAGGPTPAAVVVATRPVDAKPVLPEPLARQDATVARTKDDDSSADLAGKTISFQFTVGSRSHPVEVRGSFTITPARSTDAPKAR